MSKMTTLHGLSATLPLLGSSSPAHSMAMSGSCLPGWEGVLDVGSSPSSSTQHVLGGKQSRREPWPSSCPLLPAALPQPGATLSASFVSHLKFLSRLNLQGHKKINEIRFQGPRLNLNRKTVFIQPRKTFI